MKCIKTNPKLRVILLVMVVIVGGCISGNKTNTNFEQPTDETAPTTMAPEDTAERTTIYKDITIGIIEPEEVSKVFEQFKPTADYIAKRLSSNQTTYAGHVKVTRDIDSAMAAMVNGEIDVFLDSPIITRRIAKKSGARERIAGLKEGTQTCKSYIIVRRESGITNNIDLIGRTIAFEKPASTFGYLLPAGYLRKNGLDLSERPTSTEQVKYLFSGRYQKSIEQLLEGNVDAIAVSNYEYADYNQPETNVLLRIIAETQDIPWQVVAFRPGMESALEDRVAGIMLDMHNDPDGVNQLRKLRSIIKFERLSDTAGYNSTENYERAMDELLEYIE